MCMKATVKLTKLYIATKTTKKPKVLLTNVTLKNCKGLKAGRM